MPLAFGGRGWFYTEPVAPDQLNFHTMLSRDPQAPQLGLNFEEPIRARRIWPVRELVAQVRQWVEKEYSDVWVEGEISNLRPAPSGHVYFTLKDAESQLPIVLFRRQALLLRFKPEDGLHVLVRGQVSVYEQRGQMQLVAETMEPVGVGSLQLAFEQLKQRLKSEGLFDAERKRALPAFPRAVGIITSPTGAVIRDFLNIVNRRHAGLSIFVYPATVQGESAPAEIEAAIEMLNTSAIVDLIVVARGGGSLEDLAAFNSERVARAIAASGLPVVSAVGHETDFTIADFVADLRAPTPSAAAELITEAQHKIAEHLAEESHRLERATRFQLLKAHQRFGRVAATSAEARIATLLHRSAQQLDELGFRLEGVMAAQVRSCRNRVADLAASVLRHDPRQQVAHAREHLNDFRTRLARTMERQVQTASSRLSSLDARLHSLSPLAVLERGYALVIASDGAIVRSAGQLCAGDSVTTQVADGSFMSHVTSVALNNSKENRKQ